MTLGNERNSVFADNGNRAVALLLDLILLVFLAGTIPVHLDSIRQIVVPVLFLAYFSAMPLTRIQGSLGKWVCRIKVCDSQGNRLGWRASLIRACATIFWFALPAILGEILSNAELRNRLIDIWWLLVLLPWVSIGFMPRRQSLFDLLANSLVVKCKATPENIAGAEPMQKRRVLQGIGTGLLCLLIGFTMSTATGIQRTKNLFSRVAYAIEETQALRKKIEQFHDAEKRWPNSVEMGIPDWNPYPDGGGYRLQSDGSVVITFSVLPELKGRSITLTPKQAGSEQIDWQCSADASIGKRYLPGNCR